MCRMCVKSEKNVCKDCEVCVTIVKLCRDCDMCAK